MSFANQFFGLNIKAINIGTDIFSKSMSAQGVETLNVEWTPPLIKNDEMLAALKKLYSEEVEKANQTALNRFFEAEPLLIDVAKAIDVIPNMTPYTILHAGPPIEWENMCGPMKGAIIGLILFEGFAKTPDEAVKFAESGRINFAPCHDYGAVGPMAGVISASMYVHVFKNMKHGNLSFSPLTEGSRAKVLRFGAYDDEVLENFRWIHGELAETLHRVLVNSNGLDVRSMISQALHMGDECHNRNKAGSGLFMKELFPLFVKAKLDEDVFLRVLNNVNTNDHYFLSLSMPALKSCLDAAHGVKNSTIVTALSRNGVEFGIRVSGCEGNTWFTGPSQIVNGLYLPGFSKEDANLDMGDSAITETGGVGGMALSSAPAIVQFVGGNSADCLAITKKMYEITFAENSSFSMPYLDFRGGPCGIDIRKVVETGILPVITTGIAHKNAGVGFIGAGITNPPIDCFEKAILESAKRI
ncbi:MAG: yahG [Clostridiales bacterium]|nr:yahG [Clostridiales bacterium]